jgi:eukaryotic-like serine/threonine-protein kinase
VDRTIGRYRVVAVLGSGAMGEVVRARDERLGRDVAIKRVKNVLGVMAATFQVRFESEARALAALAHPGVVQVFDLGVDETTGDPYLVMELIEGPTLRSVVADRGALPPTDVCALGIQLARALEAAHARGILHRDVKPGNVLRGPGGLWKLADFGVAHVPDSEATICGQFLGTPAYAAPEALTLGQFSPASDVYGLAATLYEAATGARPRGDATMAELIQTADQPVIDPRAIPASLGVLGAPLAAGLALDPKARPSAAGFAELLAGLGSTGPSPLMPSVARARRVRWPLWLAAGALVVGGLVVWGGDGGGGRDVAGRPATFASPPGLDGKSAKDWRMIADKVHEGDYGEALHKLRDFERKRGASDESARLRAWLEQQPRDDHD